MSVWVHCIVYCFVWRPVPSLSPSASQSNLPSFKTLLLYFFLFHDKMCFTFLQGLTNFFLCVHFLSSRVCQLLKCNRRNQSWLHTGVRYLFRPRAEKLEEWKTAGENEWRRGNVDAEKNPYLAECYNPQKTYLLYSLYLCHWNTNFMTWGAMIVFHNSHWESASLPVTGNCLNRVFFFSLSVFGNRQSRKHLFFLKAPTWLCVLCELNLLIDLLVPPLPLLLARDLHLAGSGRWVGQTLPGGGLVQGFFCYGQLLPSVLLVLSFWGTLSATPGQGIIIR